VIGAVCLRNSIGSRDGGGKYHCRLGRNNTEDMVEAFCGLMQILVNKSLARRLFLRAPFSGERFALMNDFYLM
jgi:hypothetical protein